MKGESCKTDFSALVSDLLTGVCQLIHDGPQNLQSQQSRLERRHMWRPCSRVLLCGEATFVHCEDKKNIIEYMYIYMCINA